MNLFNCMFFEAADAATTVATTKNEVSPNLSAVGQTPALSGFLLKKNYFENIKCF